MSGIVLEVTLGEIMNALALITGVLAAIYVARFEYRKETNYKREEKKRQREEDKLEVYAELVRAEMDALAARTTKDDITPELRVIDCLFKMLLVYRDDKEIVAICHKIFKSYSNERDRRTLFTAAFKMIDEKLGVNLTTDNDFKIVINYGNDDQKSKQ